MDLADFIKEWHLSESEERANKDKFLIGLCRVLGVPEPEKKTRIPAENRYCFEADVVLPDEDGDPTIGRIDLLKRDAFVLEAKQGSNEKARRSSGYVIARGAPQGATPPTIAESPATVHKVRKTSTAAPRGSQGWKSAMNDACGQALGYARALDEPPPFVVVCDIGYCFDLYACFDGSGAYRAFPNPQQNRLMFTDLASYRELLRTIWSQPRTLDPRLRSERVSIDLATKLAKLAQELEQRHDSPTVAKFLMRCLFTMFAEDVDLIKDHIFTKALERDWIPEPKTFKDGVESLWDAMNAGKRFIILGKLLRFNGGLFADASAIPLEEHQLRLLHEAATKNWADVDPAIFGTLLERALNPRDRHKIGAHFTPRSFVERVLRPTLEEPLREKWDTVRAQVRALVPPNQVSKPKYVAQAVAAVREFHSELRSIRVLDPACGSGNFLYVALEILKEIEDEVLATLDDLGCSQGELGDVEQINPSQFYGLEVRPWAREIAELVLWIGYLQAHYRRYGSTKKPPEPILRDYKNIVRRDALFEPEETTPLKDAKGRVLKRWDGVSYKLDPVTWDEVPDEKATVDRVAYIRPTRTPWPDADFIVGNPPYLGVRTMKPLLTPEYVDALRECYPEVVDTADLVMYWWQRAAALVATGKARAFGLITTNSIVQDYSRPVIEKNIGEDGNLVLKFAIADHPWVNEAGKADVRVAMTVGVSRSQYSGPIRIGTVTSEEPTVAVEYAAVDVINSSLTSGVAVRGTEALLANERICFQGVVPSGSGFKLTRTQLEELGYRADALPEVIRPYIIGRDLVRQQKEKYIIDFFGLDAASAELRWPRLFQYLHEHVYEFRQQNPRASYKQKWWLFAEPRPAMRRALGGLTRFIATPYTAKFRPFVFVDGTTLPDAMAYAIASDDAFVLGVLSSRAHREWALAGGGRMGVGNDPRYTSDSTFAPFPFPDATEDERKAIADLGEALDAHRKDRIKVHPKLTLTDMYNVLEAVRAGRHLNPKEQRIYDEAFISRLKEIHDHLDDAVFAAYGWSVDLDRRVLLEKLVALNAARREDEAKGVVRWTRPEFQKKELGQQERKVERPSNRAAQARNLSFAWPKTLPEQVAAVRDVVFTSGRSLTANDVASSWEGVSGRDVEPALETLAALGIVAVFEVSGERRWKGLTKTRGSSPPPAAVM